MNLIIPMAGMGKRMRPHTLTIPKPLVPIAGKPIVQRLVEDIAKVTDEPIKKIGFVISRKFGEQVEKDLLEIAKKEGAEGMLFYQDEALGTAHAIQCAQDILEGRVIVAFADTLFKAGFHLDATKDGIIWVQKVEDPRPFGVVKLNNDGVITELVEKPETFVSDLAIIGIYYFKDGQQLKEEINYVIDNDIKDKGEFQLTSALENMKSKGSQFIPGEVEEWLDCGNKNATVYTNQRYLEFIKDEDLVDNSVKINNSVVIAPSYIGKNVVLENSVVGPYVSIGDDTKIRDSRIENTIIQTNTEIDGSYIKDSMLGNFVNFRSKAYDLSIGDFSTKE